MLSLTPHILFVLQCFQVVDNWTEFNSSGKLLFFCSYLHDLWTPSSLVVPNFTSDAQRVSQDEKESSSKGMSFLFCGCLENNEHQREAWQECVVFWESIWQHMFSLWGGDALSEYLPCLLSSVLSFAFIQKSIRLNLVNAFSPIKIEWYAIHPHSSCHQGVNSSDSSASQEKKHNN